MNPAIDCLCWVVSIMPNGGIHSFGDRLQGSYDMVFVDAATGNFIFGHSGGEVK